MIASCAGVGNSPGRGVSAHRASGCEDAAILTGLGPRQWRGWDCDYVIGHEIVPLCHPERLTRMRAAGRWREPHDLATEPLLYHTTAPGNWTQWLRSAGPQAPAPTLSMACDQVSILIRAGIADMGIAFVQRCLVRHELEIDQLAVPFDLPITLERGYFLCIPANRRPPAGYAAFRDWLLAAARQNIDNLMRCPTSRLALARGLEISELIAQRAAHPRRAS